MLRLSVSKLKLASFDIKFYLLKRYRVDGGVGGIEFGGVGSLSVSVERHELVP